MKYHLIKSSDTEQQCIVAVSCSKRCKVVQSTFYAYQHLVGEYIPRHIYCNMVRPAPRFTHTVLTEEEYILECI